MTAPLFLLDDLRPGRLVLDGPEGRHAATVRRLRVGEAVDLSDGRGSRAACVVVAVGRDVVELDVRTRSTEPVPHPRLVLVQALAKGDRGELAVELATEVGVDVIVPWSAERCVVRWHGERGAKALARWRSTAREAAKQSRRAWVPEVTEPATTANVAQRMAGGQALVLDEGAAQPLATVDLTGTAEVLLLVGPEGGVTDDEIAVFRAAGAGVVRLGSSVLRTSTAGAVAAAVVSASAGRWA